MKYRLELGDEVFSFKEISPTGVLLAGDTEVPSGKSFLFDYEEIASKARLFLSSEGGSYPLSPKNFAFLVNLARILAYARAGALFKVACWLEYRLAPDEHLLHLAGTLLEPVLENLAIEAYLGSFSEFSQNGPLARILGGLIEDIDELARKFFKKAEIFYTRVVGFRFREDRFTVVRHGEEKLILNAGDDVFLVREPQNRADPNAVAVIWINGEKLGYLRRTIARYLAPVMDQGGLFVGKIACVLAHYRDPNDRIYLRIEKI